MLEMKWTTLVTDCQECLYEKKIDWNGRKKLSLSDAFYEMLSHRLSEKEILILTAKQETLELAQRLHVPAVGLDNQNSILEGTSYILQEVTPESVAFLDKVYRRYYRLPVIILKTDRLCLREIRKEDTKKLYQLYRHEDIKKEVAQANLNQKELEEFAEMYEKTRYPIYDYGMWIVEEKETGFFVGEAGLEEDPYALEEQQEPFQNRSKGIWLTAGYAIAPEFRKRGYASEALNGIVLFAQKKKEEYGFLGIHCYIRTGNIPSVKTAKRCGFLKSTDGKRYGKAQKLEQYWKIL